VAFSDFVNLGAVVTAIPFARHQIEEAEGIQLQDVVVGYGNNDNDSWVLRASLNERGVTP
jgi:hypothetical protein